MKKIIFFIIGIFFLFFFARKTYNLLNEEERFENCNPNTETISTLNTEISYLKSKVNNLEKVQKKNTDEIKNMLEQLTKFKKELETEEAKLDEMTKPQM
jgi:Skp family chaperone for outer membrane proteins